MMHTAMRLLLVQSSLVACFALHNMLDDLVRTAMVNQGTLASMHRS